MPEMRLDFGAARLGILQDRTERTAQILLDVSAVRPECLRTYEENTGCALLDWLSPL